MPSRRPPGTPRTPGEPPPFGDRDRARRVREQLERGDARNRIVGHGEEDPKALVANPANWRSHPKEQAKALSAALGEVGWVAHVMLGKTERAKVEKAPVSLSGTVSAATDPGGATTYTVQSGGTTYTLEAGPSWYFGDEHPLKSFVGRSVTITGEKAADSTKVEVKTVDGTALRGEGKPPWAGGWKRVGQAHPGWSQEKADRLKAKASGCFPPGQCKQKSSANAAPRTPAR